jgi:FKBP-type peptidyl-prolyl cis-trans isomerase
VSSIAALAACHAKPELPIGTAIETATFDSALHVDLRASTRMPSGLYFRDLVAGTGPAVASGQRISVTYIGWLTNGQKFDAGPYSFRLGAGAVISGWDQGLVGMHVGGTRQLIIPSALAYGPVGQGPIPPNAVLVFNVDLTEAP